MHHTIVNTFNDDNGRIIGIDCDMNNENLVFVNCYFPTKDKQSDQLKTLLSQRNMLIPYADKKIIIGGV